MRDRLTHRGPDASGEYIRPTLVPALAFRRLRIIDLVSQRQSADVERRRHRSGSSSMVRSTTSRNYGEQLEARGHRFRSQVRYRNDRAPVRGTRPRRNRGTRRHVRDCDLGRTRTAADAGARSGRKEAVVLLPRCSGLFAFASEIKAFFAHPGYRHRARIRSAVPDYLVHGYVPASRDVLQARRAGGCRERPHHGRGREGLTSTRRYWQLELPRARTFARSDIEEATAGVRERVERAVERRLVSDVPLGAFLSGGIDSTIVVGVMSASHDRAGEDLQHRLRRRRRLRRNGVRPAGGHTVQNRSHGVSRSPRIAFDLVDTLIWHHDGPFGDSSAVPTYIWCRS